MTQKQNEVKFKAKIELKKDLQFNVKFDLPKALPILMDEPIVFGGKGEGANASRLISAGVLNCLCASLLFCLRKSRANIIDIKGEVIGTIKRNEKGRLRLKNLDVKIYPKFRNKEDIEKLKKCKNIFEDYCIVTESVRKGIDIKSEVLPLFEEE